MIPEAHLRYSVRDNALQLHYLATIDHPWLRVLLDEYERFIGRRRGELDQRMQEPLPCVAPADKLRIAASILDRHYGMRCKTPASPILARRSVFEEAARNQVPREAILEKVAEELEITPDELEESLFGDLPGERRVVAPSHPMGPPELALRTNLAMVQSLLFRSTSVEIEVEGNARAIVRHAKLRGLIGTILPRREHGDAVLEVTGPYSLFRRTLLYGRALAEIVPLLAWCARFRLRAHCTLRQRYLVFILASGDPIFPASAPRAHDSKLEEHFAREFRRIAPAYDLVREPEPVDSGDTLIFPDFAIHERRDPTRRWLVEIVGFWTADYLSRKLERLRRARLSNLILCIDEERNCGEADLPPGTPVIRFRRRIDPERVLEVLERSRS